MYVSRFSFLLLFALLLIAALLIAMIFLINKARNFSGMLVIPVAFLTLLCAILNSQSLF